MDNVEKVENAEQEDTNPIQDLIKASLNNDYNNANKIFGEVMTVKMSDLLDQEKVKLADQIYNGVPAEEEEETEIDDEDNMEEPENEEDEEEYEKKKKKKAESEEVEEEEEPEIEGVAV